MTSAKSTYDVAVVGGGHNGLVAAAYLARAGRSVLVLERLDHLGGAALLSPEAALPAGLVADLDLPLTLRPPALATPDALVAAVLPTLLESLPTERAVRDRVSEQVGAQDGERAWAELVTTPLDLHHRLRAATPGVAGGGPAVARAVEDAARSAGAELLTSVGVSQVRPEAGGASVTWHDGMTFHTARAGHVLANVAPWVLAILLGEGEDPETKPRGSDLLARVRPDREPDPWPTPTTGALHRDPDTGVLTYVGPPGPEQELADLGEVEVVRPEDVERDLAMPGGHWFHGELDWPWAPPRARLDTPAQRWGVQTGLDSVLLCGSGSRRGGGVTGLGGHSAAHALLGP